MNTKDKAIRFILLLSLLLILLPMPVFAHDTSIMGFSKWNISSQKLSGTLSLGAQLLDSMAQAKAQGFSFESITDPQLQKSQSAILEPYIREHFKVSLNGQALTVKLTGITRDEKGMFQISFESTSYKARMDGPNRLLITYQLFFEETQENHVNLAQFASQEFAINEQEYVFFPKSPELVLTLVAKPDRMNQNPLWHFRDSLFPTIFQFILLGIKHILTGYDHILFLLALVVIGLSIRQVLQIITSFTIAHSITLMLAALQIINLNARFVEIMIALSICYIALENILRKEARQRWLITFVFGLIHGFGLASSLADYIADTKSIVVSVLSFNIGVELGQLCVFILVLPMLYILKKRYPTRTITTIASAIVLFFGFLWFVERLFALDFMPF